MTYTSLVFLIPQSLSKSFKLNFEKEYASDVTISWLVNCWKFSHTWIRERILLSLKLSPTKNRESLCDFCQFDANGVSSHPVKFLHRRPNFNMLTWLTLFRITKDRNHVTLSGFSLLTESIEKKLIPFDFFSQKSAEGGRLVIILVEF